MAEKKIVAVIFGGRSVEHDVSVLTGLQFLEALDPIKYEGIPVYIDPLGAWWTGSTLTKRNNYPLALASAQADLVPIQLDLSASKALGRPHFTLQKKTLFGFKTIAMPFDIAVPAVHGSNGEDGTLAGLLDFAAIPYTGCRPLGASATMNKAFTKRCARAEGLNVLGEFVVNRPKARDFIDENALLDDLKQALGDTLFPVIVKPVNLGSSIGVAKASNLDDLIAGLMQAFKMDGQAIIEPFVANLVEYNIAARCDLDGKIQTSAIERPLSSVDILDFKNKYLGGRAAGAPKLKTGPSQGMASLNRILDPKELTTEQDQLIRGHAKALFEVLQLAGSVRIDFLCNSATGEIWVNEVNTIPGSFAYFLWEAAATPISFLTLSNQMILEGFALSAARLGDTTAVRGGATLFTS